MMRCRSFAPGYCVRIDSSILVSTALIETHPQSAAVSYSRRMIPILDSTFSSGENLCPGNSLKEQSGRILSVIIPKDKNLNRALVNKICFILEKAYFVDGNQISSIMISLPMLIAPFTHLIEYRDQ